MDAFSFKQKGRLLAIDGLGTALAVANKHLHALASGTPNFTPAGVVAGGKRCSRCNNLDAQQSTSVRAFCPHPALVA